MSETVFDLLRAWHCRLGTVDPDYTLGDLLALLRGAEGVELLSVLLSCDMPALLAEAESPARAPAGEMRFLQVYNTAELSTYVPDPANPDEPLRVLDEDEAAEHDAVADALGRLVGEAPPLKIFDATEDDPITGRLLQRRVIPGRLNGTWAGPYRLDRCFQGWGRWDEPHEGFFAAHPDIDPEHFEGGVAVHFFPVNELAHLPLRYNAGISFRDSAYGGSVILQGEVTITFGEFVHAIFWELGFLGSPEARDAVRAALDERMAEIDDLVRSETDDEKWR